MSGRLSELIERLAGDRRVRALAWLLGVAAALASFTLLTAHGKHASVHHPPTRTAPPVAAPQAAPTVEPDTAPQPTTPSPPPQDPQDQAGSASSRRARAAVDARPAFQHVPYDDGHLSITLAGETPDGRAVLLVTAPTMRDARVGWRRFLARYRDSGGGYAPRFQGRQP